MSSNAARDRRLKVLAIFGTRPEAIKLARVIHGLRSYPDQFDVDCCSTGQHRELLDQVLRTLAVRPTFELAVMSPGQTLFQSTSRILSALESVLDQCRPDLVLVQGDTTTTLCGAMAGFYAEATVGHIEAGLRTYRMREPFPEEMNRVLVSRLATLHFAATQRGAKALEAEGITENVTVTGNTGIDTLLYVRRELESRRLQARPGLRRHPNRHLIVLTTHRRESFGRPLERTCAAIGRIARRGDIEIVFPVHPNPNVRDTAFRQLSHLPNVLLSEPLDYVDFVALMANCHILVTDSGGIQEEASSLGKPVIVLRDYTEREESVDAGTACLVGTDEDRIEFEVNRLLDDEAEYARRSRIYGPYGDGRAAERIVETIAAHFGLDLTPHS
jgi:UDP-N-acetylglucosamine 2-epimerase (non-hydrolysing)